MIDAIFVPPHIHLGIGALVIVSSVLALLVTARAAWLKQPFSKGIHAIFILFQIVLMVQTLIGIKLLDQGLGPLQLYIHYLGGTAPLAFVLVFYWFPAADSIKRNRYAALISALSLLFVLMTFTIGRMYVAGGA